MRWWLLALLVLASCGEASAQRARPTATPTLLPWANPAFAVYEDQRAAGTPCEGALSGVQQYKAPGDTVTVLAHVQASLARETRPVQVGYWSTEPAGSQQCRVTLNATIGNARQEFSWLYNPSTKGVRARDDATRLLSGW